MAEKNKLRLIGPDISEHNGTVDFAQIKGKYDFVVLRCGYGSDYENQDDAKFTRNSKECERLGIPYGVYLYSYAKDVDAAASEAQHTLRLIKGKKLLFGVWYDLEDSSLPQDKSALTDICLKYISDIEKAGFAAGIYTNLSWAATRFDTLRTETIRKWIAQWNSSCDYKGEYCLWQFSDDETINGISGAFDMNYAYAIPGENNTQGNVDSSKDESVQAPFAETVTVTADAGLNVRKAPSVTSAVITAVPKGTVLEIVAESGGWGKLSSGGWVSLNYTEASGAQQYYVTPDVGLNVRSGPGTDYGIISAVPKGTKLTVVSQKDGWGKLSTDGWVSMEYLSKA